MTVATSTQLQKNFGKYLSAVMNGDEIIITKNGKEVARLISKEAKTRFLTDELTGVISPDFDEDEMKSQRYMKQ